MNKGMKTFYWLVKREFWEHRGAFLWTPLICAGVVVVLNIMGIIAGTTLGTQNWGSGIFKQHLASASPEDIRQLSSMLDFGSLLPMAIVSLVLFVVLISYCMHSLSRERTDRSILFWKSMPVSDLATVLSKVFSAMVVAPVIAVATGIVSMFIMLLCLAIAASMHGIDFGMVMWSLPHPGHIALSLVMLLPIYMIWMLPSIGWFMLCSAWSRGKPARWAIALPFAVGAVISWTGIMSPWPGLSGWFWKQVVLRIIFSFLPGSWMPGNDIPMLTMLSSESGSAVRVQGFSRVLTQSAAQTYQQLLSAEFLWGALAGIIMISLAIWLRRWRTEL